MYIFAHGAVLTALVLSVVAAESPFATIADPSARAAAVREAYNQIKTRKDPVPLQRWRDVLTEMHLAKSPDLKQAVQTLRSLELYNDKAWIELVNLGYAYTDDAEGARRFRATLARHLPDSSWAVEVATNEWESTHRPRSTTHEGLSDWAIARSEFLKRLHEQRPRSAAATRKYLEAALPLHSRLPENEALELADLALRSRNILPYDPRFEIVRLYLNHGIRLNEIPALVDAAVQEHEGRLRKSRLTAADAERTNQQLAAMKLRGHCYRAEYFYATGDVEQARSEVRQAHTALVSLTSTSDKDSNRALVEGSRRLLSSVAKRVGSDVDATVPAKTVDWARVGRMPLEEFSVTDFDGRRWNLMEWKGKVVLVNIWATWCVPCRAELPYIQKLHDVLRDRPDRLVISINVDSDTDLARRLVREQGYTFPVVASRSLANQIDFVNGVPQNRLVDKAGQLLIEPLEFTGNGWVEMVKAVMNDIEQAGLTRSAP